VYDIASGRPVSNITIPGDTDDLFYDARNKRLYVSCGEGQIEVISQGKPDEYHSVKSIKSAPGARTSLFVPELGSYYLAVPQRRGEKAEVRIFKTN
jgi:hypothetical protein